MTKSRWVKLVSILIVGYVVLCLVGGILLAELQLHPPRRPIRHRAEFAVAARQYHGADLRDVAIATQDGITLKAWYAVPENDNGSAVMLLHGVSDNREGVAGYGRMFLKQGYRVLFPDARAHGESGGDLATYGLRESDDIHRWIDWLEQSRPKCVYGFGESMGAAQLLQSLQGEARFCAVIAESPFSRFNSVAYERAASYVRMPAWFGETVLRPVVGIAIFYTRHKYGIDFSTANPADAVAQSQTPMLLIGDEKDVNILPHHVLDLARLNPKVTVWMVPNAYHTGAWAADHQGFETRVTSFLNVHGAIEPKKKSQVSLKTRLLINVDVVS